STCLSHLSLHDALPILCTFGDKMDVVWMHRYKLPLHEAIDQYGKMTNSGSLNGLKVADAKKKIIGELEAQGKVVKKAQTKQIVRSEEHTSELQSLTNLV